MGNALTAAEIRQSLLERIEKHSRENSIAVSEIGRLAVSDTSFFPRLRDGKNFSLRTYDRVDHWLKQQDQQKAPVQ